MLPEDDGREHAVLVVSQASLFHWGDSRVAVCITVFVRKQWDSKTRDKSDGISCLLGHGMEDYISQILDRQLLHGHQIECKRAELFFEGRLQKRVNN
jgi:hypothetical protein